MTLSVSVDYIQFPLFGEKIRYCLNMAESKTDLFVSGETEIEVDEATSAAIQRGIPAAGDSQVVTGEEVREQIRQWISEFSTPARR